MSRRQDVTVEAVVERRGGADASIARTTYYLPTHRGEIAVTVMSHSADTRVRAPQGLLARVTALMTSLRGESITELEFLNSHAVPNVKEMD